MKYIKQFCIILLISFLGEILKAIIPLPIPASIYGMVLLFAALCTGILKLEQVRETGCYLVEIMPIMFIPPAVGLMASWGSLKEFFVPVLVITVAVTIIVMAVAGLVTQKIIELDTKGISGKEKATSREEQNTIIEEGPKTC
jgi:holin-like protein